MDSGPIVAQERVPVCEGDTEETLAERVLAVEHARDSAQRMADVRAQRGREVGELRRGPDGVERPYEFLELGVPGASADRVASQEGGDDTH